MKTEIATRVLVTGGTGFVAGWCIRELLDRGYAVRATLRDPAHAPAVRAAAGEPGDRLTFAAADLLRDDGWDAAMAGCDRVLHVASPLGSAVRDPDALVAPARDGTLRVLRAATRAGVARVVMTSAAATARPARGSNDASDETVWTDPTDRKLDGYRRSKVLAERAAWDVMASAPGPTTLTTILPGAVFGPVLARDRIGSAQVIQRLLDGKPPAIPRFGFWVVDVRDLAALHVRAMIAPEAAGQRFIAAGEFVWLREVAATLRVRLGARAGKVPTRDMPDFAVRMLALVIPQLRMLAPDLGHRIDLRSDKARRVLGFAPRPAATTIVDCAESLLGPAA